MKVSEAKPLGAVLKSHPLVSACLLIALSLLPLPLFMDLETPFGLKFIKRLYGLVYGWPFRALAFDVDESRGFLLPYVSPSAFFLNIIFWCASGWLARNIVVKDQRRFCLALIAPSFLLLASLIFIVLTFNRFEFAADWLKVEHQITYPIAMLSELFLVPIGVVLFVGIAKVPIQVIPFLLLGIKPENPGILSLHIFWIVLGFLYGAYRLNSLIVRSNRLTTIRSKAAIGAYLSVVYVIAFPLQPKANSVFCTPIVNSAIRDTCRIVASGEKIKTAFDSFNPALCSLPIAPGFWKSIAADKNYRDECLTSMAKKARDPRICELVTTERARCSDKIAPRSNEMCGELRDPKMRDRCFFMLSLNPIDSSTCGIMPEGTDLGVECIHNLAKRLKDVGTCDLLLTTPKKPNYRESPFEHCVAEVALLTTEYANCEKISDSENRDSCVRGVISNKKDWTNCSRISNPRTRDYCMMEPASSYEDCKKAQFPDIHDHCVRRLAIGRKEPDKCKSIRDPYNRDMCLKGIS